MAGAPPLILASRSPQRRAILARLGVAFSVRPADVEERSEGDPVQVAGENAAAKARAVARPGAFEAVLGEDTVVELAGRIYGKPADRAAAHDTLRRLAGATHRVVSAVCLILPRDTLHTSAVTAVTFRELDDRQLSWYLDTGEWRGRAGGYAIQGTGAALVRRVEGDYENVVGLPLAALLDLYPALLGGAAGDAAP